MNNCEKIQFELSLLNQDQPMTGPVERHLKDCAECREFSLLLEKQNQELSDLRRPTAADWSWLVRNASSQTVETAKVISPAAFSHPMARKERTFGKIAITVALAASLLVSAVGLLPWLPLAGRWNPGAMPGGEDKEVAKLPAPKSGEKAPADEFMRKRTETKAADSTWAVPPAQMDPKGRLREDSSLPAPLAKVEMQSKMATELESTPRFSDKSENRKAELGAAKSMPTPAPGPVVSPDLDVASGVRGPAGVASAAGSPPGSRSPAMPGTAAAGEPGQKNLGNENPPTAFMRNIAPYANRAALSNQGAPMGGGGGLNGAQNNLQNNALNHSQNNLLYSQFGQADGQGFQVANAPLTDQADARSIIRGAVPTPEQKVRFTLLLCQQSAADVMSRAQFELGMSNSGRDQNTLKRFDKNDLASTLKKEALQMGRAKDSPAPNQEALQSGRGNDASPPNKEESKLVRGSDGVPMGNRYSEPGQDNTKIQEQKKNVEQPSAYMVQNNRNFYLAMVPAKNTEDIVTSYDDIVKKDIPALLSGLRSPSNKKDLESLLRFLKDSEKEFSQLAATLPQQGEWLNRVIELNKKGIALIQAHNP